MGDKYSIRIPPSVDIEMSAWDIPDDIRQSMEDHLRNQLASDPVNMLVRVIGPDGEPLNLFEFLIRDQNSRRSTYVFMFHFHYGQDEKFLHLVAGDYERFDTESGDSSTPVL